MVQPYSPTFGSDSVRSHAAISTGQLDTKFGLTPEQAGQAIERVGASHDLELEGLHLHIGSQIFELDSFQAAIAAIAAANPAKVTLRTAAIPLGTSRC